MAAQAHGISTKRAAISAANRIKALQKDNVSQRQIAEELGIPVRTLGRMTQPGGVFASYGIEINWGLKRPIAPELDLTDIERKNIRLEDECRTLKKKVEELHRDSIAHDTLREILGGIVAKPVSPPSWTVSVKEKGIFEKSVPVTIWSDWHASEVVSLGATNGVNEFNHEILERRVRRLVERTIALCRSKTAKRYPGVIINLLGDFVSGALHPELQKTDEEDVIPTTLRVRDLLVWALDRMIEAFGQVYCPCTAGNHGRATHKPEFKRYVYKSFDWLIYQMLARHYDGDKRIMFDITESNEVRYRVFARRYLVMHGDMLGVAGGDGIIGSIGPIMRGDAKVGRQSAAIGLDYDQLLMGHWHQQLWLPKIIVANALKGWDEYAMLKLRAAPSVPSQPLWFEHPRYGRHDLIDVLLEDPVPNYGVEAEWVSFRGSK